MSKEYLEIYNNEERDLLGDNNGDNNAMVGGGEEKEQYLFKSGLLSIITVIAVLVCLSILYYFNRPEQSKDSTLSEPQSCSTGLCPLQRIFR